MTTENTPLTVDERLAELRRSLNTAGDTHTRWVRRDLVANKATAAEQALGIAAREHLGPILDELDQVRERLAFETKGHNLCYQRLREAKRTIEHYEAIVAAARDIITMRMTDNEYKALNVLRALLPDDKL